MSTFTKTLTTVNDKALALAAAAYNATLAQEVTPLTDHEYLDRVIGGALKSWQDQYIRIPASEFLLRFPAGKIDAIKAASASNQQLAAYVDELRANPYVYTGSTLVRGGIAMLVSGGLLTQAQADVILE
jgi:hypothetical protein